MLRTLWATLTFRNFVEAIKWDVIPANRLVCQTLSIGEVEVAEVPVLEFLFCLCHNAMSFVITGAKTAVKRVQ